MDNDVLHSSPLSRRAGLAAAGGLGLAAATAWIGPAGAETGRGSDRGSGHGGGRKAVTLLVTRHGRTMLNTLDRVQGWSDSPLTDAGVEVAQDLGRGLALEGVEIDAVHCGDMVRHHQTASAVLETFGAELEPIRDERLREISFGSYEGERNGVMWTAIAQSLGHASQEELFASPNFDMAEALDAGAALSDGTAVPAETSADCADRALAALEEIAQSRTRKGGTVLVVTSGLTIYLALDALGADLSSVTGGFHNASVSTLTYQEGSWTIGAINDMHYAEQGADA